MATKMRFIEADDSSYGPFPRGRKNVFLVIVTRPAEKQVHGYRVLDLDKEYGIGKPDA